MKDAAGGDANDIRDHLLRDINIMLNYAFDEGMELGQGITQQVSKLWPSGKPLSASPENAAAPASPAPASLAPASPAPVSSNTVDSFSLDLLLDLHGLLVKLVAPATPVSILVTTHEGSFWNFLRRPPLIGFMIAAAIISMFGFIFTSLDCSDVQQCHGLEVHFNWFFAATLGAAFYILFTAYEYVKDRTFDPTYNSVYCVRFVLGIIAGFILAYVVCAYVHGSPVPLPAPGSTGSPPGSAPNNPTASIDILAPGLAALLGGFSTEAVNQILQRLVDILLTTVKGDGSDALKAKQKELEAKSAAQISAVKLDVKQSLSDIMADQNLPQGLRDKLKAISDKT